MRDRPQGTDDAPQAQGVLSTTATLLTRIRGGDDGAREVLIGRFLPPLRRWAHGRVARSVRNLHDTDDLVQVTLLKALDRMKTFEPRHRGSFLAYLRRIFVNEMASLARAAGGRPTQVSLDEGMSGSDTSPLEAAIGSEALLAYEAALERLPEQKQEAIFLRIEMGFTHEEVARELDLPSADAARMLVTRALVRLSEMMHGR